MIQVGQVLDKYELLERVGQGGMSVVYRATDRSLRRTVAVKILHRHLADSAEARDRFEREAHAVAKLRHENIVEIFAYSGRTSEDSYIVTEFIDGTTLKEFIGDHPISFPEVGAMLVLQVGRALAHAHAAGILHRDIKPENVMIRSDGVVKLMDFGISQMVDLQRLTVTGQLLGSPAYMSPEHVEGQPLDFRTDVFACGIVLYQLSTGRLPFEGKNPHEILKRIADCRFTDPRQANPRVGNELGKIILKAMAREPADRYRNVGEMVAALDAYCTGSGLGPAPTELSRYFQSPATYEMALKERLIDHLVRKGKETMPMSRPQALESFDRVLTVDPSNSVVLAVLEKLSDRRRWKRGAMIGVVLLVIAGGAYGARKMWEREPSREAALVAVGTGGSDQPVRVWTPDTGLPVGVKPSATPDAAPASSGSGSGHEPRGSGSAGHGSAVIHVATPDAAPAVAEEVTVQVSPSKSELSIAGGPFRTAPGGAFTIPVAGDVRVDVKNDPEFVADFRVLHPEDAGKSISINLLVAAATVTPRCNVPDAQVSIDGSVRRLDLPTTITFGDTIKTEKQIKIEFVTPVKKDTQTITVHAGSIREVPCAL